MLRDLLLYRLREAVDEKFDRLATNCSPLIFLIFIKSTNQLTTSTRERFYARKRTPAERHVADCAYLTFLSVIRAISGRKRRRVVKKSTIDALQVTIDEDTNPVN